MQKCVFVTRVRTALTPALLLLSLAATPMAGAADDPAFQYFDNWLARRPAARAAQAQAAAADVANTDVDEGRRLARERRAALVKLARTNPRQALAKALRRSQLQSLPAA